MPIDVERAVGARLPVTSARWSAADVILYHLAVGAGAPPTDVDELEYTYEARLKVLPSYGVLPALGALSGLLELEAMDVDLATLLHGEQDLELHAPIPACGSVETEAAITAVHDKGKSALVILEAVSRGVAGEPLFTNRFGAFFRGEGGFGGAPTTAAEIPQPSGAPDRVVEVSTLAQQALLYRLTGDKNPLHVDPAFAAAAGFPQPILHGLCTYGLVCKVIVDTLLSGDVRRIARYRARFSGVLFPGETVKVSLWRASPDQVLANAMCVERGTSVLSHVIVDLI